MIRGVVNQDGLNKTIQLNDEWVFASRASAQLNPKPEKDPAEENPTESVIALGGSEAVDLENSNKWELKCS